MSKRRERGSIGTVLIMLLGCLVIAGLWYFQPKPKLRSEVEPKPPLVDVLIAEPRPYRVNVKTQGTIVPRREINLVAEVSGRVVEVAEGFVNGGFFNANELLVKLDDRDYRNALIIADTQVATAERELALEQGQARQAKREWRDLGSAASNALSLRQPQLKAAKAALNSSKAERNMAVLNVERAQIKAPFAGRVRSTTVDLGQFVPVGATLGTVYDSTAVEVRLPLSNEQLALTDLAPGSIIEKDSRPSLMLSADVGGQRQQWPATLTRMEASIDTTTRFYYVIAEVEQPFDTSLYPQPLLVGLFVEADIPGREFEQAIAIPQKALVDKQVFTIGNENKLTLKDITIINKENGLVWVKSSIIQSGERIVVSDPRVLRDGILVRTKTDVASKE